MLVLVRGILIHSQMNMGRSLKKIQRWKRCQKGVVLVPNLKMILIWNVMLVLVRGKRKKKRKNTSSRNASSSSRNSNTFTDEYGQEFEENPEMETMPEESDSKSEDDPDLPYLSRLLKRDPDLERLLDQVGEPDTNAKIV
mmetsp:Transcript_1625/g.2145  ORF Transcript_1625/g.2145 Transcript_1625/m.2145 type:complete len:140 (-) Transcript_1625:14-433(-)